ncbi:hypothetical protein SAMD00023353_1601190 [Rosellinia necatrix]|uniref:Uncharacterized protein n=1 Tax=Rosellinia necatrix TaxID=77044 RepID=A0A1S8A7A5_ROSNE|nr:hypothetical protein SAMD00023353_1601190 [Rosellinia necatrix]
MPGQAVQVNVKATFSYSSPRHQPQDGWSKHILDSSQFCRQIGQVASKPFN